MKKKRYYHDIYKQNMIFCLQIQYGKLVNCFSAESGESKCIVNMYYTIKVNGEFEKNSKDCPLLISSRHLIVIDPEWIES